MMPACGWIFGGLVVALAAVVGWPMRKVTPPERSPWEELTEEERQELRKWTKQG